MIRNPTSSVSILRFAFRYKLSSGLGPLLARLVQRVAPARPGAGARGDRDPARGRRPLQLDDGRPPEPLPAGDARRLGAALSWPIAREVGVLTCIQY